MSGDPELRIAGDEVSVKMGRRTLARTPLAEFVSRVAQATAGPGVLLPRGVRLYRPRGHCAGVAVEIPPQARRVRWITDASPAPFGGKAEYRECFLAFPYVILLLVVKHNQLTNVQQLFYRRVPLRSAADQELLLPNLTNVADAYGLRCWLCLQHLPGPRRRSLTALVDAVIDHVFNGAFNRSAERHEGNSYWGSMRDLDPRVASLEAWEQATRENFLFALDVPWKSAGVEVGAELEAMLARVEQPLGDAPTAKQLAGLVTRANALGRRR